MTNHGAALATKPGRCGMKKKLPKKGTAGGPEKKRDTRSAHSLVWSFGFLKICLGYSRLLLVYFFSIEFQLASFQKTPFFNDLHFQISKNIWVLVFRQVF